MTDLGAWWPRSLLLKGIYDYTDDSGKASIDQLNKTFLVISDASSTLPVSIMTICIDITHD